MTRMIRRGDRLPLNSFQRWLGEYMGQQRQQQAEVGGFDQTYGEHGGLFYNVGGAQTELAFARALNLFPELQLDTDTGQDLLSRSQQRIDTKWNPDDVDLIVSPRKLKKPCAFYLVGLGHPEKEGLTFGGWASKEEVFRDENLRDLGNHGRKCYVVRAAKLHPVFTS